MTLILEDQQRRGPDNATSININQENLTISLAHNRLAILDLSDESNQPFVDPRTGACIVFNGEIYNYREIREELVTLGEVFTTQGDTEVLLKAFLRWGEGTYMRLLGMYAFAVWNPLTGKLTLARDRFGVKPCYYLNRLHQFAFASNTTALARFFNLNLEMDYLARGVSYNLYEDSLGASPYQEIRSLPPGHFLEVDSQGINVRSYYNFRAAVAVETHRLEGMSEQQLFNEVEERLSSATYLRMRSDVPVTISLSGGLDSALILSEIAKDQRQGLEAFTFGSLEDPRSEGWLAKESADALGIKLNFVTASKEELPEIFERTLTAQGAPFAHPSVMAQNRVFEKMHQRGYRVSLGGQGADEVFMGYRKFQFFYLRNLIRQGAWSQVPGAGLGLAAMLGSEMGGIKKLLLYRDRYSRRSPPRSPFRNFESCSFDLRVSHYKDLQDRQIADVGFASLLTLLRYEDRNSMGHSVESRMPFLDYRVMETGLALPDRFKIRHGYGKWILRKLAKGRLPRQITHSRSKMAFALDSEQWLREGLGQHIAAGVQPNLGHLSDLLSDNATALLKDKTTYLNPKHFPLMVTAYWLAKQI